MAKPISEYNRKRNFDITTEPPDQGRVKKRGSKKNKDAAESLHFVIQKHDARRLHYDFRLELDGTLKSWAVPKGPSLDPKEKRLAVHVEDHPLGYAEFEGNIPAGQYGAGDVIVWDHGIWQPKGNPAKDYSEGKLKFTLIGEKLAGDWTLVRTSMRASGDKEQWLLIKEQDEIARPAKEYDIVKAEPASVLSGALVAESTIKSKNAKNDKNKNNEKKKINVKAEKNTNVKKSTATTNSKTKNTKPSTQNHAKTKPAAKNSTQLPARLSPELATLASAPPSGDWLYELKFDGYRILTRIMNGEVRMFTRNGNDWTERLPLQVEALQKLDIENSWLDGEVVVLNDTGLPDFQALQNAFDVGRSQDIIYYVFDALFLNGKDLRSTALEQRREGLEKVLPQKPVGMVRFSAAFTAHHGSLIESACAMGLEGVIGKRAGSLYQSRRSGDWIKLKCRLRQEFVIIGYTKPKGSRTGFGALLLGVYDSVDNKKSELVYAGRVGTGFNQSTLTGIHQRLQKLERDNLPLKEKVSSAEARDVQWVKPELVCEVEFAEWTKEGRLRQAAFIALRSDKPARQIVREQAKAPEAINQSAEVKTTARKSASVPNANKALKTTAKKSTAKTKSSATDKATTEETAKAAKKSVKTKKSAQIAEIKITHPERVVDPQSGITKAQLAEFYEQISTWILPHLKQRPVSLVRLPNGLEGEQFFQKHAAHLSIPKIVHLDKKLDPGHAPLMEIDNLSALIGSVQMGTIEFHTWGATSNNIEKPDHIVLDLDPDPALPWKYMQDATRLTQAVLDELGLDSFLKTSGGKGIHIIIPLARRAGWDEVKEFSKSIAEFMARQIPERFVAKMGPKNRIGKIFIDYLRNQRGASTVSAYSVRARPGLPVSVPITRGELQELRSAAEWNVNNLHERLASLKEDPWQGYQNRQKITAAMKKKLAANK